MKIEMEKILERDIDLLIINKFSNDNKILELFNNKVGLNSYNIEKIQHSLTDENGESDITVILSNGSEKIAYLIEDKIDAEAMPKQRQRYDIRGTKGIENNIYNKYFVFIIAPDDYLKTNTEAKKYENQISYEELAKIYEKDIYARTLLEQAIEEKKKGYIVIENQNVTKFWENYYRFIDDNFPMLCINRVNGPRGNDASWPIFNTPIKNYKIRHKSDRGYMDLEFPKMANKYFEFIEIVNKNLDDDMTVQITSKSISIRLLIPKIDFKQDFNNYINEMQISMNAVVRLENLLAKLDIKAINELTNLK